jgi:signal transduction histidine kinase
MTRRLSLALLAFTAALLVMSIVPLGLLTASRERQEFRQANERLSRSLATLSEEPFDEDYHGTLTAGRLAAAAGPGVGAVVMTTSDQVLAATGRRIAVPPNALRAARVGRVTSVSEHGQIVSAAPIAPDGPVQGVIVVARSDSVVEHRVDRLWLILCSFAAGALLLSLLLAVITARWVSRPLAELKDTAWGWAEGRLGQRAAATSGPPEVRAVAVALNAMAGRLDALVASSRATVADVSHQVRTPLSAIRLRLELIRGEVSGAADDDVAAALAEIDRLSRLVNGLLAVAHAEHVDVSPEPVDLSALVEERRQAWQPVADGRGVTITVDADDGPHWASATPGHLEQALDNVLANALDAVSAGAYIVCRVRSHSERVVVSIADDGPGMPPALQRDAFRRFVSGNTDREPGGLGLAIVHRLVTTDGGSVGLESAPGNGTTVTIELPAYQRHSAPPLPRP